MKAVGVSLTLLFLSIPLMYSMAAAREWIVYVGTYTRGASKGIYAYRFTSSDGRLAPLGLAAEVSNPSFLAAHPNQRFLYAVNENDTGTVTALAIDPQSGKLKLLNSVSSRGSGPCHLALDKTGKWIFVANYNNGSIAVIPVRTDGTLGDAAASIEHSGSSVDPRRQSGPHAHSVNVSPDNRFLIVTDLGLDQVLVYRFDPKTGSLAPNDPPFIKMAAGAGPRHFTFSPDGKSAWVLNEMNATLTALSYDRATGRFTQTQTTSTLPSEFTGAKSAAEILVHPKGRLLYTSNRGHDSIAIWNLRSKEATGPFAWVPTRGRTPRNFAIDPAGAYIVAANQDSNNLAVYRVDATKGELTPVGEVVEAVVPVSVVFAVGH
jgi:6-phosphogluconolactonase